MGKILQVNGDIQLKNNQQNLVSILDYIYPIGAVILTRDTSFDPSTYYGGTWIPWTDGYIKAVGKTNTSEFTYEKQNSTKTAAKSIGSYKISSDNLPKHTHNMQHYHNYTPEGTVSGGNHRHKIMYDSDGKLNYGRTIYDWSYNESDGMYIEGNRSGSDNWVIDYSGDLSLSFTGTPKQTSDSSLKNTHDGGFTNSDFKPQYYPVIAWERTA